MHRSLIIRTAAIGILIVGFSKSTAWSQSGETNTKVPAPVPKEFRPVYSPGISSGDVPIVWAGFPCDSISLERSGGMTARRDYKVIFHKGGAAELHMNSVAPVYGLTGKGDLTGTINILDYGKLCHLISQVQFEKLPGFNGASNVDFSTYTVSVLAKDKTKKVSDNGFGPIELWTVQMAIDAVAERIRWKKDD